jgi:hypothetical protein
MFYLQDKRSFVGNDVVFWAEGKSGYTTDVSKAHVFTKDEAFAQHRSRNTDIPWPKEYIDARTRPAVDFQYVNIKEALAGVDAKLEPPPKVKRPRGIYNCSECGKFVPMTTRICPHCEAWNDL